MRGFDGVYTINMSATDRYDVAGPEGEFESGSGNKVLKNTLGIKSLHEIEQVESDLLLTTQESLINIIEVDHRFTANDICSFHRMWLENLYEWAGKYRRVHMSKDGFRFASPMQIEECMVELEKGPLKNHTPCNNAEETSLSESLAVVHAELIIIHPFREGNGRLARLLASLMAYQAGYPTLDFSTIHGEGKDKYIDAIQDSAAKDYSQLIEIFKRILKDSVN